MGVNRGLKFLATYMVRILPGVQKVVIHDEMAYLTIDKHYLNVIVRILKSHYCIRANCLLDIWGSDYPEKKNRFEVNYMLLSIKYNFRVVLRVQVAEFEGIESLTPVFNSAGWLEREVWDMYGVMFFNHKDLRRILTDYGFDGHPLRKDFPLSGFMEVRYDDGEKRVVYEPLEVAQEYRSFNFRSPWERL